MAFRSLAALGISAAGSRCAHARKTPQPVILSSPQSHGDSETVVCILLRMTSKFAARARFIFASFLFLLLLASASMVRAQETPRFDVFGGFSYLRFDASTIGYPNYTNLYGWNGQAAGAITRRFGVAIDLSGNYGSEMTAYHFMIGPQYTWRRDKSKFFFHALFGKAQNNVSIAQPTRSGFESVGRSFAGGGGFDYDWKPRISIRVFQADFFHSNTFGTAQNDVRVSTGVVYRFGHIGRRRKL